MLQERLCSTRAETIGRGSAQKYDTVAESSTELCAERRTDAEWLPFRVQVAECRVVVRANRCVEKMAPMQKRLAETLAETGAEMRFECGKKAHGYFNCVVLIQKWVVEVQNDSRCRWL